LHKTALAYVWQNVAAMVAAYADERPPERDEWSSQEPALGRIRRVGHRITGNQRAGGEGSTEP
jgi:hypothetical protein